MKNYTKKGFSFGEVLLSVLVLGVSLVGTINLISKNIFYSIDSRNVIIASGLAQEGNELVRNIRDSNWAAIPKRASFESGFPASNSTNCRIDMDDTGIACGSPFVLNVDAGGFYRHNTGGGAVASRFRRLITINYTGSGSSQKAKITSLVSWSGNNPPSTVIDCKVSSKCVYSTITLSKWGED